MTSAALTARHTVALLALRRACLAHSARRSLTRYQPLPTQAAPALTPPLPSSQCLLSCKTLADSSLLLQRCSFSVLQACWSKKKGLASDPGGDKEVNLFDANGLLIGKMTVSAAERRASQSGAVLSDMGVNADGVQGLQMSTSGTAVTGSPRKTKTDRTKGEKEFRINAQITDHDLAIKLKNIKDILSKGKGVKINISLRGHQHMKQGDKNVKGTFHKICQETADLAIVRVANKLPTAIAFQLQPKQMPPASEKEEMAA